MIGQTVGPYRILEQLGQGGMGVVYTARDERLGRTVALKFLPPQLSADPRASERFRQEARAASALDHANICTIYDIGQTDDGRVYIVMAHYDGQTLKYRLEDGPIAVDETIDIVRQIARGLSRAHEAGMVHRDIKPANIMVTARGEVKILDFGLAKLASSADLTREGSTIGTAAYMSPEQSRGETVDARSDLWSLGVVAYEMLAGKRPFGGGYDAAVLYAILNEEPAPIDEVNPAVPAAIARVVARCLAKDPAARYADVNGFRGELERAAGLTSGASSSHEVPTAFPSPPSGSRLVAAFGGAAAVTLGIVYAAMHFFGLPDWVFAVGVALMAVGLPIVLWAGRLERGRAGMDSGERRALTGLPAWLTVRRAALGGVAAMGALTVVSALWMALRALGIGPAGTLVTKGALAERDFVLVADFENRTQDPNLAISVTEAFRIDLSESSVVNVVDGSAVRGALERMQQPPDLPLLDAVAMEVAERTGAKAVVVGEVSSVGRSFVLSARLVATADGTELAALRENADDDGALLAAIDRLSGRLRERIGESLVSIRGGEPLEDVTTSSLEALRAYSEAERLADQGEYGRSAELLERAVAVDSTFAMAWRKLAVVRGNAGLPGALARDAAERAYRLRDRLPERERLLAEAFYHYTVVPDADRVVAAYEAVLDKWPDDVAALNNLAIEYRNRERYAEAETLLRHAYEVSPSIVVREGLVESLAMQRKFEEAQAELERTTQLYPQDASALIRLAGLTGKRGDRDRAAALLDSAEAFAANEAERIRIARSRIDLLEAVGQYSEADRLSDVAQAGRVEAGFPQANLNFPLGRAQREFELTGDTEAFVRDLDRMLAASPMDLLPAEERPYMGFLMAYAMAGRAERAENLRAEWFREVPEELRGDAPILADALLAFARRDYATSLRMIEAARRAFGCTECAWDLQAEMYVAMDSVAAAIRAMERHVADDRGFEVHAAQPVHRLRLGEWYDRQGDARKAIENYSLFIEAWADADRERQPWVDAARRAIDRLLAQQAREPGSVPAPSGS